MRSRSIPTAARIAPRRSQVDPSGPNPLLRLEKSKPQLDEIETQIQAARSGALPKSVLAKACKYTLTLWTRLTRIMEHPELELCTNLAENAMRPVALGRRNWIHIGRGTPIAGHRLYTRLMSVLQSGLP